MRTGGGAGAADRAWGGERVVLRAVEPADYPWLLAWQNDPEIARWMNYPAPFTARDIEEDQARSRQEGCPFTVTLDGRPVGKAGLNQFRPAARACALYMYIGDQTLWGRGVGRDALCTLLAVAFDVLGLERVELSMVAGNRRAQKTYESCGFVWAEAEGPRREDGLVTMTVDRARFAARRPAPASGARA